MKSRQKRRRLNRSSCLQAANQRVLVGLPDLHSRFVMHRACQHRPRHCGVRESSRSDHLPSTVTGIPKATKVTRISKAATVARMPKAMTVHEDPKSDDGNEISHSGKKIEGPPSGSPVAPNIAYFFQSTPSQAAKPLRTARYGV